MKWTVYRQEPIKMVWNNNFTDNFLEAVNNNTFSEFDNLTQTWSTPAINCTNCTGHRTSIMSYKWGILALSTLILGTALGNILVILAVCWERRLQNMTNYFLLSLALADFLVSILVMPLGMVVVLYDTFPFSPYLCVAWLTCDVLMCTASIWHMCIMSMDRFLTLRYPMKYGRNKTKTTNIVKILSVWLISIIITSPISIMGFMDTNHVYMDGICAPTVPGFMIYGSVCAFYIPLAIMVTTYVLTIKILQKNQKLAQSMGRHKKRAPSVSNSNGFSYTESLCKYYQQDQRPSISSNRPASIAVSSPEESEQTRHSSAESDMTPTSPLLIQSKYLGFTASMDSVFSTDSGHTFHMSDDSISYGTDCSIEKQWSLSVNNIRESHILTTLPRSNSCPNLSATDCDRLMVSREVKSIELGSDKHHILPAPQCGDDTKLTPDKPCNKKGVTKMYEIFENNCDSGTDTKLENAMGKPLKSQNEHQNCNGWAEDKYDKPTMPIVTYDSCHNLVKVNCNGSKNGECEENRVLDMKSLNDTLETECMLRILRNGSVVEIETTNENIKQKPSETNKRKLSNSKQNIPTVKVSHHEKENLKWSKFRKIKSSLQGNTGNNSIINLNLLHPLPSKLTPIDEHASHSDITDKIHMERRSSFWNDLTHIARRKRYANRSTSQTSSSSLIRRVKSMQHATKRLLPSKTQSNEEKASKVLGIIFGVFVIFWTPFFIMNLLAGICLECINGISPDAMNAFVWLGYISSLANPVIYTCFNTSFRRTFIKILQCGYLRKQQSPYQTTASYVDRFIERRGTDTQI